MRDQDIYNENLKLCYASEGITYNTFMCYFTHRDLSEVWGDDWDDYPWWCNAEPPYDKDDELVALPIYFGGGDYWEHGSRECSAEDFSKGLYPWLVCGKHELYAGTTLGEVRTIVEELGGCIYLPHTQVEAGWYA